MRKFLTSLLTIFAVASIGFLAANAFFSDTEKSVGNLFQAGAIDLKIDSEQHYNNMVCTFVPGNDAFGTYQWVHETGFTPGPNHYPVPGSSCDGTWPSKDLGELDKFFNFTDLKPGDFGENTISFEVLTNDAWMCAELDVTENSELGQYLDIVWWVDTNGDNMLGSDEKVLYGGPQTLDEWLALGGNTGFLPLTFADSIMHWETWPAITPPNTQPILANETHYVGVGWCFGEMTLEPGVGRGFTCSGVGDQNDAQGDKVLANLSFSVEQYRNNPNFVCPERSPEPTPTPTRVESGPMSFSSTGWGGWSCPAGTHVVGGGYEPSDHTVLISEAADSLSSTYPTYPHYTYPGDETGWVVQNGETPANLTVYALCQPNQP